MNGGKWQIGDVTITRIVEMEITGFTEFLLPDATPEAVLEIPWLQPHFANDKGLLKISFHALVVETPDRRIIVDTCVGNDKERAMSSWTNLQTEFLKDLAGEGYERNTIDTVLCTHLHIDHVGWNTMLVDGVWKPTFPNARYLFAQDEYDHTMAVDDKDVVQIMSDSVTPVFEAGLVDLVETDHKISEHISFVPTLGHTPGHVSILIESKGERGLITGDFVHNPCQMARPHWGSTFDTGPQEAVETRKRVLGELAGTKTLVIGTHFAAPTAGHIVGDGEVWRFEAE